MNTFVGIDVSKGIANELNNAVLLPIWYGIGFDEIAKRLYDGFLVEPAGFHHIKFSSGRNNKTTVCDAVFPGFDITFGLEPLGAHVRVMLVCA